MCLPLLLLALGRCALAGARAEEAVAAAWCDGSDDPELRPDADAERHTLELDHGDVCREPGSPAGWFFCPKGCTNPYAAPYCADAGSTGFGKTILPCRLPRTLAPTPAAQRIESPADTIAHACDFSDDVDRRDGAVLERHTLEGAHGDICRNVVGAVAAATAATAASTEEATATVFFCPRGCQRSGLAPYCADLTGSRPCRVPLPASSALDRLTERLSGLTQQLAAAQVQGNPARVKSLQAQIKLVKGDLRRASGRRQSLRRR
jgi:hypothetical protein